MNDKIHDESEGLWKEFPDALLVLCQNVRSIKSYKKKEVVHKFIERMPYVDNWMLTETRLTDPFYKKHYRTQ